MQTEQPRYHPVWSPGFSRANAACDRRGKSRLIAVNRAKKNSLSAFRTVAVLSVRPGTRTYAHLRAPTRPKIFNLSAYLADSAVCLFLSFVAFVGFCKTFWLRSRRAWVCGV